MEPSSAPAGGAGRGSVGLDVVAGFGGRWRRELALLRGHSGVLRVGSRPADPGGAAAAAALARRSGGGAEDVAVGGEDGTTGREGGGQVGRVREAEKERGGPENK